MQLELRRKENEEGKEMKWMWNSLSFNAFRSPLSQCLRRNLRKQMLKLCNNLTHSLLFLKKKWNLLSYQKDEGMNYSSFISLKANICTANTLISLIYKVQIKEWCQLLLMLLLLLLQWCHRYPPYAYFQVQSAGHYKNHNQLVSLCPVQSQDIRWATAGIFHSTSD